ncbi:MAG: hypothetical protein AABX00_05930 [Nanoarchaeota archaeon]
MSLDSLTGREFEKQERRRTKRASDKATRPSQILFGDQTTEVIYGKRFSSANGTFNPNKRQIHKVDGLVEAVKSPNPKWIYAAEILQDLGKYKTSTFPSTSFYEGFLVQMGAIVSQRLPVVVYIERNESKLPIGYSIRPYQPHQKAVAPVIVEASEGEHQKPPYVRESRRR